MTDETPCCPHCQGQISLEMVARIKRQSTVTVTVHPHDGQLLDADTVGGTISDYGKLLLAFSERYMPDNKMVVLVSDIRFNNGAISIDFLGCEAKAEPHQKEGE